MKWIGLGLCSLLAVACSSETGDGSLPPTDGGGELDAGSADADSADAQAQDAEAPDTGPVDSGVTLGDPIVAPDRTWTWIDFPDSACDDGSASGVGVNISSTSSNVLVFLNGGGSCFDYDTCYVFNTAVHGPFASPQFAALVPSLNVGGFDRGDANNVFRDWSLVFVPYCTGDLHGGDNVITYHSTNGAPDREYHHKGRANFTAFMRRLAATFAAPGKWVLSGASAGGYGVLLNYPLARAYWPEGQGYAVDDSGPVLRVVPTSTAADPTLTAWGWGPTIDQACGADCRGDLSLIYGRLAARFPNDRLSLLSSLQDQTIRSFQGLTGPEFETALLAVGHDLIEPTSNFEYFFILGESHTMLAVPNLVQSQGITLSEWMRQQVEDDAGWRSLEP